MIDDSERYLLEKEEEKKELNCAATIDLWGTTNSASEMIENNLSIATSLLYHETSIRAIFLIVKSLYRKWQ